MGVAQVPLSQAAWQSLSVLDSDETAQLNYDGTQLHVAGVREFSTSEVGRAWSPSYRLIREGDHNRLSAWARIPAFASTLSDVRIELRGDHDEPVAELSLTCQANQETLAPMPRTQALATRAIRCDARVDALPCFEVARIAQRDRVGLPSGEWALVVDGQIAQEGVLEPTSPGGAATLDFNLPYACAVARTLADQRAGRQSLTIGDGSLRISRREERRTVYQSATTRDLPLDILHPIEDGWQLSTAPLFSDGGDDHHRFHLPTGADSLVVAEHRTVVRQHLLRFVTPNDVAHWQSEGLVSAAQASGLDHQSATGERAPLKKRAHGNANDSARSYATEREPNRCLKPHNPGGLVVRSAEKPKSEWPSSRLKLSNVERASESSNKNATPCSEPSPSASETSGRPWRAPL